MTPNIFVSSIPFGKAYSLAQKLETDFFLLKKTIFSDGEICLILPSSLNQKNIVYIHEEILPLHDKIMELSLFLHSMQSLNPKKLIICLPYFAYSRQDSMRYPGQSVGGIFLLQLFHSLKVEVIVTLDLHSVQIIKHSPFPVHNISVAPLFAQVIKSTFCLEDICLVSPDRGGIERVKNVATILKIPYISMDKKRLDGQILLSPPSSFPDKKYYLFVDDIIDSGNTLLKAADICPFEVEKHVYATHGIFSQQDNLPFLFEKFKSITITDSYQPLFNNEVFSNKLVRLSCTSLLETTIKSLLH